MSDATEIQHDYATPEAQRAALFLDMHNILKLVAACAEKGDIETLKSRADRFDLLSKLCLRMALHDQQVLAARVQADAPELMRKLKRIMGATEH